MKIKIREIIGDGIAFEDRALPAKLDLLEEFIDQDQPVIVEGRLERVNEIVLAQLSVTYTLDTICARCLEPIHIDVTNSYDLDFELHPGDEFIDIGARVREELLICFSRRVLCREDCKGICQGCGVYLNDEKCECKNKLIKE